MLQIKANHVHLRLDDLEAERLEALSIAIGVSRQELLRMLLKRAHDERARGAQG